MGKGAALLLFLSLVILVLFTPSGAWAQESGKRHALALFVGDTYDDGDNGFTLGLDYEYRLSRWLGLGGMLDLVGSGDRELALGVPVFFHATPRLKFELAAGFERTDDDTNPLVRLGAMYGFPLGPVALLPNFALDFVDSDTVYVFGVNFEWKF
jgi:hypothetical protein